MVVVVRGHGRGRGHIVVEVVVVVVMVVVEVVVVVVAAVVVLLMSFLLEEQEVLCVGLLSMTMELGTGWSRPALSFHFNSHSLR